MSKKKSYMDRSNILNEGPITDLLRGLFSKKLSKRDIRDLENGLKKSVKAQNDSTARLEKLLTKKYGKKVKLKRVDAEEVIQQAREN